MTSAMPLRNDKRLVPIDGLRGIAVLLVIQFHFWGMPFGFGRGPTLGIDRFAYDVMKLGWVGVDLFFVLSGFLITGILLDVKGRGAYFRTFYARRALRIIPPYYAFLLFVIVVIPLVPAFDGGLTVSAQPEALREDQFWFWTFLFNVGAGFVAFAIQPPFMHNHFWTLAVEEQFYLIWPMIVLLFARTRLQYACFALIMTAFMFRIALTEGAWPSVFTQNALLLMPARMDTLALGALVAIAARDGHLEQMTKLAPAAAVTCGLFIVALAFRNGGFSPGNIEVIQWGYLAVGGLFTSVLLLALAAKPSSLMHRTLTTPVLVTVGKYSYGMYIVHLLTGVELSRQFIVHNWTPTVGGSQVPLNIIFSIVATAITFGIAWVSWHVLEQPILAQKRRFTYGRPASRPTDTVVAPATAGGVE